ncbi:CIC11C00000002900 [Sungouiella intermedia]|uniref:Cytochrome c oxidase subunit 6, mitochondrial n=1 Tax=Sungouiella intermedia TaxID=45354 RepID=A0A1L0DBR2_9ASCO|nr:CIC11C00000002900 [[Candida] intermedia]
MISSAFRSTLRSRALVAPRLAAAQVVRMSIPQIRMYSSHEHKEETFEEFTARYEQEFEDAYDLFEVQRVLNNCFSYDLVPSPSVIQKALEACRRVNDYPTAVRTFEALKHKVENKEQYQAYLDELKETRQELGIDLKEDLYSDA